MITTESALATKCLGVERTCDLSELATVIPEGATQVDAGLGRAGINPHDDLVVLYRALGGTRFQLLIGRPTETIAADGLVAFSTPEGPTAVTMHVGPYEQLGKVADAMVAWCGSNSRIPTGYSWETYHHLENPEEPSTTVRWGLRDSSI